VAEFIGSPAMNLVDAERGDGALSAHGVALALSDAQRSALAAHGGGRVVYGLRPENLAFGDDGLPGALTMAEPTGPETYLTVDTAVGKLTARVPGHPRLRAGDRVHLQWRPEHAHLFDADSGQRVG
jgi:multiple sugar transport system ATP-binding protein